MTWKASEYEDEPAQVNVIDVWWDKNRDAIFASARKGLTPAPEV